MRVGQFDFSAAALSAGAAPAPREEFDEFLAVQQVFGGPFFGQRIVEPQQAGGGTVRQYHVLILVQGDDGSRKALDYFPQTLQFPASLGQADFQRGAALLLILQPASLALQGREKPRACRTESPPGRQPRKLRERCLAQQAVGLLSCDRVEQADRIADRAVEQRHPQPGPRQRRRANKHRNAEPLDARQRGERSSVVEGGKHLCHDNARPLSREEVPGGARVNLRACRCVAAALA